MGMHAEVGTLIHHDRSARELYEASVFFYKWIYVPPAGQRLYGELEEIPLPRFSSPSWSLPDMMTSEVFRAKMRLDFRGALKPRHPVQVPDDPICSGLCHSMFLSIYLRLLQHAQDLPLCIPSVTSTMLYSVI